MKNITYNLLDGDGKGSENGSEFQYLHFSSREILNWS